MSDGLADQPASGEGRQAVHAAPANGDPHGQGGDEFAWLASELARSGAVQQAHDEARRLILAAKAALTRQLHDSPARQLLLAMANAVLDRNY